MIEYIPNIGSQTSGRDGLVPPQGGPSAPLEPPRGPMSNLSERSAKTPVL